MAAIATRIFRGGAARAVKRTETVSTSTIFEKLAFYGVVSAIALVAVPYGTVEPWHRSLLVFAMCLFGTFRFADAVLRKSFSVEQGLLFLPLIAVVGIAILQTVAWPGSDGPISVDPYETTVFIILFAGMLVAAEILFAYTNSPRRLRFLLGLVFTVGLGSAIFGLLRVVLLDEQATVLTGYFAPDQGYAQFINRNHFAMLMEMCLGLILGLLIKGHLSEVQKFAGWIVSGIMIYSIIASTSRGGLISLAALSLFATFVHIATRESDREDAGLRGRMSAAPAWSSLRKIAVGAGLGGLVVALIIVTIAFVGGDTVVTRIEKLEGEIQTVDNTQVSRSAIWNGTIDLIKERPWLGSGFGAYAAAITRFDTSGGDYSLQQAHNDYLEILANGGIVGFTLFAVFGSFAGYRISKNLKTADSLRRSACFGASIGIFGVLIHSFVDFGLHIPVIALIFITLVVIGTVDIAVDGEKRRF